MAEQAEEEEAAAQAAAARAARVSSEEAARLALIQDLADVILAAPKVCSYGLVSRSHGYGMNHVARAVSVLRGTCRSAAGHLSAL